MKATIIKQHLHNYLEIADDKKLKAIYTMVEDEIKENTTEYSEDLKKELDNRVEYYLSGGKMITPATMNKRLQSLRNKRK